VSIPRWIEAVRARRTARFLVVGAYNTVFGYVVFVGLYYWIGDRVHYNLVLLVSYIISVTNSYLLQRRFVFSSTSRRMAEFLRFNVVNLAQPNNVVSSPTFDQSLALAGGGFFNRNQTSVRTIDLQMSFSF